MTARRLLTPLAVLLSIAGSAAARQDAPPAAAAIAPIVEPQPPALAETDAGRDAGAGDDLAAQLRELAPPIRILILLSVLTLLPTLLLTLTSYTRIIIVLSFVRRAIGAQELPPNAVLVGMSLFLTGAIMSPTFARVHDRALAPFLDEGVAGGVALDEAAAELKTFMLKQTRHEDLGFALQLAQLDKPARAEDAPLRAVVPAFVLSELRTAFRMGFLIFLPFVLIDLVVAAVLLSLGMFMLPPTIVAMPLKILLFVLVDGWSLTMHSLVTSFAP